MDNRSITEYKLIIKVCNKQECVEYDPLGLCRVEDCIGCPNARVKIIRQDNVVMRDDFKRAKNTNKIKEYRRILEQKGVTLFEEMFNIKFNKFQKWYLDKLLFKMQKK